VIEVDLVGEDIKNIEVRKTEFKQGNFVALVIGDLTVDLSVDVAEEFTSKLNKILDKKHILSVATRNISDLSEEELEDYRYELRNELKEVTETLNARLSEAV